MAKTDKPTDETVPEERHRDVEFDVPEEANDIELVPDFETEEDDDSDEVFSDDEVEGPDVEVDPNESGEDA